MGTGIGSMDKIAAVPPESSDRRKDRSTYSWINYEVRAYF